MHVTITFDTEVLDATGNDEELHEVLDWVQSSVDLTKAGEATIVDSEHGLYAVAHVSVTQIHLPMVKVLVDDDLPYVWNLEEFAMQNADDEDTCLRVRALSIGQSVTLGGGAGPDFTVKRVR